jgi:hypothetical protein
MKWIHLRGSTLIFIIGICLFLPNRAHAYLDLGSGSLIFQFLVASLLGGAYMARSYLKKIKNYILSPRKRNKS